MFDLNHTGWISDHAVGTKTDVDGSLLQKLFVLLVLILFSNYLQCVFATFYENIVVDPASTKTKVSSSSNSASAF